MEGLEGEACGTAEGGETGVAKQWRLERFLGQEHTHHDQQQMSCSICHRSALKQWAAHKTYKMYHPVQVGLH